MATICGRKIFGFIFKTVPSFFLSTLRVPSIYIIQCTARLLLEFIATDRLQIRIPQFFFDFEWTLPSVNKSAPILTGNNNTFKAMQKGTIYTYVIFSSLFLAQSEAT